MTIVSQGIDDYLIEKYESEAYWYAVLSDGTRIYQDDYRPGVEINSAWIRFKQFLKETGLKVEAIILKFRSHTEVAIEDKDAEGFFFSYSALGGFGMEKTQIFYLLGKIKNNKVYIRKWYIPELIVESESERDIKDCKEEQIIWNN